MKFGFDIPVNLLKISWGRKCENDHFEWTFQANKIQKLSSFKSNENIHKREDGSYYVVSANKASSVTL